MRAIGFRSEIYRYVPQVGLFPAADCAVGHEYKPTERRDLTHQLVAFNPGFYALIQRQVHSRRTHFHVKKKTLLGTKRVQ
jgi:hypothetical protein